MIYYLLQNLFWMKKGMPVMERYRNFSKLQWSAQEDYEHRVEGCLGDILDYALNNIPFYREQGLVLSRKEIISHPREVLRKLPVLEKSDVINRMRELFIDCGRGSLENSTGGSTGQPVTFMQDKVYITNALATTILFYAWAGRGTENRLVKLWGAERDLVKGGYGLKQKLSDFIENKVTLNAFQLSPERMSRYLEQINRLGAYSIEGYAEILYEFSKFIEENGLKVNRATSVISSAGTLYPHMREQISRIFRSNVYDRYGSREAGNMAAECEQRKGLHIFGETTYIEVVDKNLNEVAVGEEGDILVTNLTNYTMPLIRYRIGDRAVKGAASCACGRPYPLLKRIAGRSSSSFRSSDGSIVSPEFFIHLFGVMTNDGSIVKFQAVQEAINKVRVAMVLKPGMHISEWRHADEALRLIKKVMGEDCKVTFDAVNDIPKTPSGKYLYTISKIGNCG